jgi:NTP pyrophosphatase (non-canonical NTP hydrolase)
MEMHALHGMCGEIGELHSLYQKMYQGHQFDKEHAMKELGDLLWFVAEYCTACDITLEDVAKANIAKLNARYPEGFEADKSLHRKEGDI